MQHCDVIIIGGGPAGLMAAAWLEKKNLHVVLLEREPHLGGVPHYSHHHGFGFETHYRFFKGPDYVATLKQALHKTEIRTGHSCLALENTGTVLVHCAAGQYQLTAPTIILATGAREAPRAARFISGNRASNIINTASFQKAVYLEKSIPFKNPIIIGSEWVSYSALMTAKSAHIKPVAIVSETPLAAPFFFPWGAKLFYAVPSITNVKNLCLLGEGTINRVSFEKNGKQHHLPCDGVIISGEHRPENALLKPLGLQTESHFQLGRARVFLAGNMLGELKTAGKAALDGAKIADQILQDIR